MQFAIIAHRRLLQPALSFDVIGSGVIDGAVLKIAVVLALQCVPNCVSRRLRDRVTGRPEFLSFGEIRNPVKRTGEIPGK